MPPSPHAMGENLSPNFILQGLSTCRTPCRGFKRQFPDKGKRAILAYPRALLMRSGVKGTWRSRTPVASNIALHSAAATGTVANSPAPEGSTSR